jgi:BirA family transcriptional regulator, biotin operon repressor / biotin---[acetyl-CoA-carboxylase] ligase
VTEPQPLDAERLRARLVRDGRYAALDVVSTTGSTSADLAAAARRGARDRSILIAEEQVAGRGRMQRGWTSLRGYGLYVSVLLRPAGLPPSALAWLPLITGVALADTVARTTELPTGLKWPNDLLLGDDGNWYKAAGILADAVGTADDIAVVVGMGVNVYHRRDQLPVGGALPATSLAAQGAEVDREEFAAELLTSLADVDEQWRRYDGDVLACGLFDRYRHWCRTLGQEVKVDLGSEHYLRGTATEIDPQGRLLVRGTDGAVTPVSAGDVVHVRPASPPRQ